MSESRSLLAMIAERIEAGDYSLPARDRVSTELHELVRDPEYDSAAVVRLITGDAALTTEILRVANGALYAGLSKVATVRDAVVRLGSQQVLHVAVQACEKQQYRARSPLLAGLMEPLWVHAASVAHGSAWLAEKLGYRDLAPTAFVGGLLHDAGKLLLVKVIDDIFAEGDAPGGLTARLVEEILESLHTTQGHALAEAWGLPDEYVRVIRDHHQEDLSQAGTLVNLVSLANKACVRLGLGLSHEPSLVLAVAEEAQTLGASDIALAQLLVALEDLQQTNTAPTTA